MKRSNNFYAFLLLGIFALIIYGFLIHVWLMIGLIAFSSVFNFVFFLVKTKVNIPAVNEKTAEEPIDFYNTGTRNTYYKTDYNIDYTAGRKVANAD